MFIEVSGTWINPSNIAYLWRCTKECGRTGTTIVFDYGCTLNVPDKSPEEVVAEISLAVQSGTTR